MEDVANDFRKHHLPFETRRSMCDYSVVIPCYRSGEWIEELVTRISDVFEARGETFEVILVNDASPDETWPSIQKAAENRGYVRGVNLLYNTGQYRATLCGLDRASGDYVLTMDDDLQHPPEEIPKLIQRMHEEPQLDCVLGKFPVKRHGPLRNLGSRMVSRLYEVVYQKPRDIVPSSFRLMTKRLAKSLLMHATVNPVINSLVFRNTRRIENVEVDHQPRTRGTSGYTFSRLVKIVIDNMFSVSSLPLRFVSILGLTSAALAFVLGVSYLIRHLIHPFGEPGFATIVLLIVFFGGMTLFSIGLVGEYMIRIMDEVKGRPWYVIRDEAGSQATAPNDALSDEPVRHEVL